MTPSAKTSARASSSSPRHCSGAMYAGVPALPTRLSPKTRATPKSSTFTAPRSAEEHVRRLEIAVHHVRRVGVGEGTRDLDRDPDCLMHGERTATEPLAEILALEQLEDEIRTAVRPARVVERDDVRMRELRGRLRLAEEPLVAAARPDARAGAERLERDEPPELAIARLVHHPEAAATDLAEKLEPADDATRPQRGRRPFRYIGAREVVQELRQGTRRRVRSLRFSRSALRIVRQVAPPRVEPCARSPSPHSGRLAASPRVRRTPAVPTAGRVLATGSSFPTLRRGPGPLPNLERRVLLRSH